jgi:energy-coupling factor transport system ATP-binding protein
LESAVRLKRAGGNMGIVKAKNLTFEYIRRDEDGNVEGITKAVDNVSIDIKQGDFVAVLGHNGSGKSTFAKHLNALVMPTEGTVWVDGMDTREEENTLKVRQTAGMVFQNPDNQIVGTLVDEEVGFGPENIGVPTEEIWERVEKSLKAVGMYAFRNQSPNKLSGGQKQRVAIAGIVAMKPKCIVLDEPTAMLDPLGRKDVLNVLHELNRQENVTVILITHYMEEVIDIDKLYVMDDGKLVMSGTPREIFSQVEKLKELRLDVPHVTELAYELQKEGVPLKNGILTSEEFTEELIRVRNEGFNVNNSR